MCSSTDPAVPLGHFAHKVLDGMGTRVRVGMMDRYSGRRASGAEAVFGGSRREEGSRFE
jgi:hypothetical protein